MTAAAGARGGSLYGLPAPDDPVEARRAAGAYYTPSAVVDRIVAESLDGLGGRPRLLDPACGGGSFLVGALRALTARSVGGRGARGRIAREQLFGVDRDPRAAAAARAAIEREVGEQLPELMRNVVCGDALALDLPALFPSVAARGGFDAVVGNPPWVRLTRLRRERPAEVAALAARYRSATGIWDLYMPFVERALELARPGGRVALLLPIQVLHQPNGERLRQLVLERATLRALIDFSHRSSQPRLFRGAQVKCCALVCEPGGARGGEIALEERGERWRWPEAGARKNRRSSWKLDLLSPRRALCERLRASSFRLDELCYVTFGLRSCAPGRGRGGKQRLITDDPTAPSARPYLEGREVDRFSVRPSGRMVRYLPAEMYSPRRPELFEARKIVSRSMLSHARPIAALDEQGHFVEQSLVCIVPHGVVTPPAPAQTPLELVLASITSRVGGFYFRTAIVDASLGGGLYHATPGAQRELLVPRVTWDCEEIVALVRERGAATDAARALAIEEAIDDRIERLYALTDEERAMVRA